MNSGYQNCRCCGEIIITGDITVPHLCDDCNIAGCHVTRDACGDWDYWHCEVHDAVIVSMTEEMTTFGEVDESQPTQSR